MRKVRKADSFCKAPISYYHSVLENEYFRHGCSRASIIEVLEIFNIMILLLNFFCKKYKKSGMED